MTDPERRPAGRAGAVDGADHSGALVLTGALILDGDGRLSDGCRDIVIRDGGIAAVVAAGTGPGATGPAKLERVDCAGCVVTPGLVALHTHAPMVLFRGLAEDVSIDDWFNIRIWPYESRMTGDEVAAGARLAIAEMLDNGVTAFADHYFEAERIADVVVDTGIRGQLAPTIFGLGEGVEDRIEAAADLIQRRRHQNPRLSFRMGPHAPYTCPPPVLAAVVSRAGDLGVGIHLHISETREQVAASREREGRTPFAAVAAAGGFDLPVIVGHGLWVEEDDLPLLGLDTWFAVSPKTYLKLAMGQGNLWRLAGRLNLATGTDGAASSNTLSPLEQARLWALVGKQALGSAERFTLDETWRLLMNGHRALGQNTGEVAPGRDADLVVWDLEQPNTAPVHDVRAAIVYSAEARNVRDVLVAGRLVKRDHRLVSLDARRAVAEARAAAEAILARGPGRAKVSY